MLWYAGLSEEEKIDKIMAFWMMIMAYMILDRQDEFKRQLFSIII